MKLEIYQEEKNLSIKCHQKQLAETIHEIETFNSKANALLQLQRNDGQSCSDETEPMKKLRDQHNDLLKKKHKEHQTLF